MTDKTINVLTVAERRKHYERVYPGAGVECVGGEYEIVNRPIAEPSPVNVSPYLMRPLRELADVEPELVRRRCPDCRGLIDDDGMTIDPEKCCYRCKAD